MSSATSSPDSLIEVVHQTFSSIDQLREKTPRWDLDLRQLDRGRLVAPHVLIMSPNALFTQFSFGRYRNVETALQIEAAGASDLRRHLQQIDRETSAEPGEIGSEWIRNELEHEIPAKLLRLLATNPRQRASLVDGFKARAARRARNYIEAQAAKAPAIQNVCRAAGVSWRALNYAFRELFWTTPKQYLQATRLNGVRKDLRRRGPDVKIADTASAWGFWHMGQFARDYKRHFSGLPSETARCHEPDLIRG